MGLEEEDDEEDLEEEEEDKFANVSEDDNIRKSRRSRDKPRKRYDDLSEEGNKDDDDVESPKKKRGRPGRPKKVVNGDNLSKTTKLERKQQMRDEDIAKALEESYDSKRVRKQVKYDYDDEDDAQS